MKKHNNIQEAFIYPDFGTFYSETFGSETVYNSYSHRLHNIAKVDESLFSSISIVDFEGQKFLMSLDFGLKLYEQLIKELENKELKKRIKKELSDKNKSPAYVDFTDNPIELILEAKAGKPESNQNESYIPFVALSFSSISSIKDSIENECLKTIIPPQITHVLMTNNTPIAFAVQRGKQKKNDPDIINVYVCYPDMPGFCDHGPVYTFKNLKEAKNSFAWKLLGGMDYAIPVNDLGSENYAYAELMWQDNEDKLRAGFGSKGIKV